MTCGNCVARVKSELLKIGDVLEAQVQLQSPQAIISMAKHVSTEHLQRAVANAGGYKISDMPHSAMDRPLEEQAPASDKIGSYFPIFLIFGYITVATILVQLISGEFAWTQWMAHFMAGFFLVFSFFKLLNLREFSYSYRMYDIVARNIPVWGLIYPFVELALGLLFLSGLFPTGTVIATFLVMGVSMIGVIQSLQRKQNFQCACLGTIIKLPLSKLTLFEDALMVAMSGIMILVMI